MIAFDNNPLSCAFNINNVFPVKSWFGDPADTELKELIPILKSLAKVKDVRDVIEKIFSNIGITHAESNKLVNDQYQLDHNIAEECREMYAIVMGNYYPPLPQYDPEQISRIDPLLLMMQSKYRTKVPMDEINMFLFNHVHSNPKYSEFNVELETSETVSLQVYPSGG